MSDFITPIALVAVIGILAGLILAVASKVMYVHVDEKVIALKEVMPGANCGACGFAGCDAYATKLATDSNLKPNLCPPGGENTAKAICEILGVEFEGVKPQYAVVKCGGTCEKAPREMDYQGIETCQAAKQFFGGTGKCTKGCNGFGDCAAACPYDAINIVDGVAVVDRSKCIGCGVCIPACPFNLITIIPSTACVAVTCSSNEKGASKMKNCKAACIGCKKCEKVCESGAITVDHNRAHIDEEKCTNCKKCISVCPTSAIKFLS